MENIFNLKFCNLMSYKYNSVCLPCTNGTWIRFDLVESGPQILNFEVKDGKKSVMCHTCVSNDNQNLVGHEEEIEEMFTPFFSQTSEKAGMNEETFYRMKSAFQNWIHYEGQVEKLCRIGNANDTQWDTEPLFCNTVKKPMKAAEEELPAY